MDSFKVVASALICKCMNINDLLCARLNGFMLKADESDYDMIRACATLAKSGSRSPVSNSFSFSGMLSWKRAVVTEDLMQSGMIRDFIELRDSDGSESYKEQKYLMNKAEIVQKRSVTYTSA